jgi:L-ribulose-5-phosphate 3-epimerase
MRRREFLSTAVGAVMIQAGALANAFPSARPGIVGMVSALSPESPHSAGDQGAVKPMAVGLMIQPMFAKPEIAVAKVRELGMTNCFLSLDDWIGKFSPAGAKDLNALFEKYGLTPTSVEIVKPGKLEWDFVGGPATIGLVPRATRAERIEALKQTSDFAKLLGVPRVQTHCGFLPENPQDPLYKEAVLAIREVAVHCAINGQDFLMETGQETPTTLSRAIMDVKQPNLGVGLDVANLILYGKANPVDAVDILGPHVKSVHAKDGLWPTDPMKLGEEVLIGTGRVDFVKVFSKLNKLGYRGAITIERETSGPQQIEDVKHEKIYLEQVIAKVLANQT